MNELNSIMIHITRNQQGMLEIDSSELSIGHPGIPTSIHSQLLTDESIQKFLDWYNEIRSQAGLTPTMLRKSQ